MKKYSNYLLYLGLALGICHPFLYYGVYTGDGVIHIIFAKNALAGHLFQFNPGQFSGGETSPGYMFFLAALIHMYGEEVLPALIKTISIFALYGIGYFTYQLAKLQKLPHPFSLLAAVVVMLLPGTAYNGMIGTENGLFAVGIMLLTYELLKRDWLTHPENFSVIGEVVIGICLGVLFLIRPEAAPYAGIIYSYRLVITSRDHRTCKMALSRGICAFFGFIFIAGAFICFYRLYTGLLPYSAGVARSIISKTDTSIYLGAVAINLKFLQRLIYYCSITLPALFAIVLIARKKIGGDSARMAGLFLVIFVTFFILYSTILPSFHLARYIIFLWPFLVLAAVVALAWLWDNFPHEHFFLGGIVRSGVFFSGVAILFLVSIAGETYIRRDLGTVYGETHLGLDQGTGYYEAVLAAPYKRNVIADKLYKEFGSPAKLPVNIAVQEVQIRYWLDDRFVVYSLDGIVDSELKDYIHDGYYDHIGYFIDREIDFFQPVRNYNKDKSSWSLARLKNLEAGERIIKDGVELVKLPNGWVKVTKEREVNSTPENG